MELLNVDIISKEMIKPSSPTPNHFRNLKLSFLDQISPQVNRHIDCNDAGAEFIEARVDARLIQVIKEPRTEELQQLLPVEPLGQTDDKAILSVKISFFNCGGIAIGEAEDIQPSFDLAFHFPPKDLFGFGITPNVGASKEKITTKRLVFDKKKLTKLKQVAASGEVKNPTRVEALLAFIWHHYIQATRAKMNTQNITSFAAVPADSFGNCWRAAFAILSQTEDSYDLVTKLRYAIAEIDDGYIKKLLYEDYLSNLSRRIDFFKKDIQVDFGWGKPVWVCTTTLPFKNLVILMGSLSRNGIEAWVNVPDDDLEMLETHYKQLNAVNSVDMDA
ncbi:Vinorine synthase [Handroanthus impetiginosus]|uniref:Vinorine synthase n=1 Tax=Handroanthus impetiginosus TaxID=429701 RepID=A0A2G9HC63_9LAMI|nr:Vinorine synthase [Handroanthus impetiginosus]